MYTSREMMVALITATTASLATCLKVSLASSELLARPCTMMADDWFPRFPPYRQSTEYKGPFPGGRRSRVEVAQYHGVAYTAQHTDE